MPIPPIPSWHDTLIACRAGSRNAFTRCRGLGDVLSHGQGDDFGDLLAMPHIVRAESHPFTTAWLQRERPASSPLAL